MSDYTTATSPSASYITLGNLKKLSIALEELQLQADQFRIPIYKTDDSVVVLFRPSTPQIVKSNLVDEDKLYIMADYGIICGKDVFEVVWDLGISLRWEDSWKVCEEFYEEHLEKETK